MAHTKQMPRNPNVDRPTTAIGSDVQPEGRTSSTHMSKKLPIKGGKQPQKHLSHKINKMKQTPLLEESRNPTDIDLD